jgi:flagellar biosynthesis/type III secretory pathway chaperone
MKDVVLRLFDVIEAEIAVEEETHRRLGEQEALLATCTLDKLEAHLNQLDHLKRSVVDLDRTRVALMTDLAGRLGVNDGELTLAKIAGALDEPEQRTLLERRDRLMGAVRQVRAQSRRNMILIRQSMELNLDLLSLARGEGAQRTTTYSPSGNLVSSSGKSTVDAKV